MIPRLVAPLVRRLLAARPAVALIGPRQSGKTTLARSLSPRYFDLEQPGERLRLDLAWDRLVTGHHLVVLDEAQAWPELFPRLRGAIDAARGRRGRFLLLGSVSPSLVTQVSESLAGRLAIVELTPFLTAERPRTPLGDVWLRGGFPDGGIRSPGQYPRWQQDYLALLAQRDLPQWGLAAKYPTTQRLLRMLAVVHGQIWNATQVGQSLGLSYHTVNSYVDVLEGAFLVRRLPPWLRNLKKRIVRSPRLYWRDSGLLHGLLGIRSMDDLLHQPWVGASWEGFVIEQITGFLGACGETIAPHYFRTSDGYEVDLVFQLGSRVWAVEAKLSASPGPQDYDRLVRAAELAGADRSYLVAQVARTMVNQTGGVTSLPALLEILRAERR